MPDGILDGKTALVAGVANKRSIAWAIAQTLHEPARGSRSPTRVSGSRGQCESSPRRRSRIWSSSATCPRRQHRPGDRGGRRELGGLDIMVHSIAYAPPDAFQNRFIETPRETFATALDISAYSMIAMARAAEPLMNERRRDGHADLHGQRAGVPRVQRHGGGQGGPRERGALPGVRARPRVDAGQRDLGRPGAHAGRQGIADFDQMESIIEQRSPLGQNIEAADVGQPPCTSPARCRRWSRVRWCTSTPATTRWGCSDAFADRPRRQPRLAERRPGGVRLPGRERPGRACSWTADRGSPPSCAPTTRGR